MQRSPGLTSHMRFASLLLLLFATSLYAQTQKIFSNIDEQSGWESCSTCAGGANSTTNYSGPTIVSSPSLDGRAAQFSFTAPLLPYTNALWWRQELQGAADAAEIKTYRNFRYDLWYYIKDVQASQALEFDVNQTICDGTCPPPTPTTPTTSMRYIFGTECNLKNTKTWRIWDGVKGWVNTNIACTVTPYKWIHLVYEFQRAADRVYYISLTIDGRKYYVNRRQKPYKLNVPADDLNVAFQMDGTQEGTPYSTWLDKIMLTVW